MTKQDGKIQTTDIERKRCLWAQLFHLTPDQQGALRSSQIEVVFSVPFLSAIFSLVDSADARSPYELENSAERVRIALHYIGVETFKQLVESSYDRIARARGLGPGAMALVLDVLLAFGYKLDSEGTPHVPSSECKAEAAGLLQAIGLSELN